MTALFRSIVVWLVLLALPYQGYAAAQMLLCAVPAPAAATTPDAMPMPAGPHDHAAMLAAQADHHAAHSGDGGGHHTHSSAKCNGAACCAAAVPMLALAVAVPAPPPSRAIPFHPAYLPAVDLAHPERPPQAARA